jgi:hypothetical protein
MKITSTTITIEQDRRYRIRVMLNRSDRPRYFTWQCPQCTYPVCEIVNCDIVAVSDTMDMTNLSNAGPGVRCDGRYQGGRCNIWWYFSLGE